LTFDDGPTKNLPRILSILEEENVQGLFFWQAKNVYPTRPWEVVFKQGHEMGTHGYRHCKFTKLSYEGQRNEMRQGKETLEQLTGREIRWFRPPFGLYNEDTIRSADELNLRTMLWQIASWDWKHREDPDQIIRNVTEFTNPGDIILLHELPQTVNILKELIQELRTKGFVLKKPATF
jgi:peptidoglycan/xylan/chitin deacetylase (PgdA/CDA1 family)